MSLRKASSVLRSNRIHGGQLWRRTLSAGGAALANTYSSASSGRRSNESCWEGFAALSLLAGFSSISSSLAKSKCEEEEGANEDEESYDVFSSSDPMDLPYVSDDGVLLERILLTDISNSKSEELQDESSDFSKSVRAFGSCLESTAAIRRRDTPLATSKGDISVEERISTLGQHENETVTTRNVYFYKTSHIHDGMADKFVLLAGPSSEDLGGDIGHLLGVGVNRAEVGKFADG